MKNIRKGVFETNSSSCHVLTLYTNHTLILSDNEYNDFITGRKNIKDNHLCSPDNENSLSFKRLSSSYDNESSIGDENGYINVSGCSFLLTDSVEIDGEIKHVIIILDGDIRNEFIG